MFNAEVFDGGGTLDAYGDPYGSSVTLEARHYRDFGTYRVTLRTETYRRNIGGDTWGRDQECARLLHKLSKEVLGGTRMLSELELRSRGLPGWASATYRLPGRVLRVLSDWALPNWLKRVLRSSIMRRLHETERLLAALFAAEIFITFAEQGYVTACENPHNRPHEHRGAGSPGAVEHSHG